MCSNPVGQDALSCVLVQSITGRYSRDAEPSFVHMAREAPCFVAKVSKQESLDRLGHPGAGTFPYLNVVVSA